MVIKVSKRYEEAVRLLVDSIIAERQRKFLEAYVNSAYNLYEACKKSKIRPVDGKKFLGMDSSKLLMMLLKMDSEEDKSQSAPSLEWTIGQYKEMFDDIKERLEDNRTKVKDIEDPDLYKVMVKSIEDDEESLRKLLKLITDFQSKFSDMINQELVNINSYSLDKLIDMADTLANDVKLMAGKLKWYESGDGDKIDGMQEEKEIEDENRVQVEEGGSVL